MAEIGHPASRYRVTATFVNGKAQTFYCEDFDNKASSECLWVQIDGEDRSVGISYHNLLYIDIREQTEEEIDRANEIYRGVEVE